MDFRWCRLLGASEVIFGGYQDAAELGEDVGGGVPADGRGWQVRHKGTVRSAARGEAVARLADIEDLLCSFDHDFRRPAGGVSFGDLDRGVGGDEARS